MTLIALLAFMLYYFSASLIEWASIVLFLGAHRVFSRVAWFSRRVFGGISRGVPAEIGDRVGLAVFTRRRDS